MSDKLQCHICGDPITNEMGDNPICGACALASELCVMSLQARIAELEKSAIVWHKYPDEKPECQGDYGIGVNVMVIIQTASGLVSYADYNTDSGKFWRYGGQVCDVIGFAYLPEPPEVEG